MSYEEETQEANEYSADVSLRATDLIRKMILCMGYGCREGGNEDACFPECKFKPSPSNEWKICKHKIKEAKDAAGVICQEIINVLQEKEPDYEKTTLWHPIDFYKDVLKKIKQP